MRLPQKALLERIQRMVGDSAYGDECTFFRRTPSGTTSTGEVTYTETEYTFECSFTSRSSTGPRQTFKELWRDEADVDQPDGLVRFNPTNGFEPDKADQVEITQKFDEDLSTPVGRFEVVGIERRQQLGFVVALKMADI